MKFYYTNEEGRRTMQIEVVADKAALGEVAAERILQAYDAGALQVLGVATGGTPISTYRELARRSDGRLHDIRLAALDEYVGLPADHPGSYTTFVREQIAEPLGIPHGQVGVPRAEADDLAAAAANFERQLQENGGVDLQILGIGANGHIGFNEPGSQVDSRTRAVTLADRTRRDNARFFDSPEDVPHEALTQGIGTILEARSILLLASGARKAEALARAMEQTPTAECPASWLQLHPAVFVVADEAAAASLSPDSLLRQEV
ncbi:glucosamine-6-phosphate deaminase [Flexivirga endophytica]|uniref:Glucosamine-6-phosphate deaminase n=1 Tax=Flexivirga endophytica TaxID=1849103 RepID=A0A916WRV7_9MICO|nr:glucosamine-6-phosphate deaminase [Flexivirga endophytica]GGB23954.1 glucosamine-6-phosphate deaminase [Flexivirga endophytica]GHB57897.1 glucosamine-6-phosphate deaminase [Flexivirga endophytica]